MEEQILVDDLNVNEKVKRVLKKLGIKYVNELEEINIRQNKELSELGEKYISQLENELYSLGIDVMEDYDILKRCKEWRKSQEVIPMQNDDKQNKDKNSISNIKNKYKNSISNIKNKYGLGREE